jgi:S1-C subfamily serine protease
MSGMTPRTNRTLSLAAAVVAGALIGAGGGAATYAVLKPAGSKTVVRQVTVADSQPASTGSGLSVSSIYQLARKGVVEVSSAQGQGSGFVYDANGHVLTNQHVVSGASSLTVKLWNGKTFAAQVVGTDPSTDLAVLKISAPASELFPLTLGDSGKLVVGDNVVAIGSPFGLEETVTSGIVSALHREMRSPNGFAIDDSSRPTRRSITATPVAAAQRTGKVVGINSQSSDSGGSDGVGFAIPSVRSLDRHAADLERQGTARLPRSASPRLLHRPGRDDRSGARRHARRSGRVARRRHRDCGGRQVDRLCERAPGCDQRASPRRPSLDHLYARRQEPHSERQARQPPELSAG